jgi:hypothetical protein
LAAVTDCALDACQRIVESPWRVISFVLTDALRYGRNATERLVSSAPPGPPLSRDRLDLQHPDERRLVLFFERDEVIPDESAVPERVSAGSA